MTICTLTNGNIEMIDNSNINTAQAEILNIIEENLGKDFKNLVQETFENIEEETEDRLDKEVITEYEGIADAYSCALNDILVITRKALRYVDNSKRINRNEVYKHLNDIYVRINEEI